MSHPTPPPVHIDVGHQKLICPRFCPWSPHNWIWMPPVKHLEIWTQDAKWNLFTRKVLLWPWKLSHGHQMLLCLRLSAQVQYILIWKAIGQILLEISWTTGAKCSQVPLWPSKLSHVHPKVIHPRFCPWSPYSLIWMPLVNYFWKYCGRWTQGGQPLPLRTE